MRSTSTTMLKDTTVNSEAMPGAMDPAVRAERTRKLKAQLDNRIVVIDDDPGP